MKAVLLDGFGGREVLKIGEAEPPVPKPDQVLVRVLATSVNRADIVQREGNYPPPEGESEVLGLEVAGIIEDTGSDVSGWKQGDRVMSLVGGGGYGQYAVAYADHLISIPDGMTIPEAACVCEVYITAFLNIFLIGGFEDSENVLVHGGGGGVNTAAIQLSKTLTPHSKIIITASPGKIDRVKQLGADFVINYREQDFAEAVRSHTQNYGVDLILDHIGQQYFSPNLKCLAIGGRLLQIGVVSGAQVDLNLAHLMVNRQQIIGSVLRARPVKEKGEIVDRFTKTVIPKFADRTIRPLIYKIFSLNEVAEAHRAMEESLHFGKIVLEVPH
jgi:putative PIG3 family NAD(P)H quinone oxidoreductase